MKTENTDKFEADPQDQRLEASLARSLQALSGVAVAFSGGVDSSYLLAVAAEAREGEARAILGVSPSLGAEQHHRARVVARSIGVQLEEVETSELDREAYRANLGNRCFHCKDNLFAVIRSRLGGEVIVEGTNRDDVGGHRPGMEAALRHGVRSPLLEAGLSKATIRRLSRQRGLITADAPSSPCLASRFPAGVPVNAADLGRVEAAEACLRREGFREFRVRHHGDLARIEVPVDEVARLAGTALGVSIAIELEALGYRFVTIDLLGFRSGSGSALPK